jgi:uncharacterized ion transporter superfamily protein YfcC
MSLLSILVLMLILHDHRFRMVLSLFSICLQSFSWQISSRRLKLALIINFISSNSVLLIHHEFEGGIRYVLAFSMIVFIQRGLCIFLPPVHVYIWVLDPQMNTSAIHNKIDGHFLCMYKSFIL